MYENPRQENLLALHKFLSTSSPENAISNFIQFPLSIAFSSIILEK